MTAQTPNPLEQVARDIVRDFTEQLKKGCHRTGERVYFGSKFSAARWIETAEEAIDEQDYGYLLDMMDEDGWARPAESYSVRGMV